MKYKLSIVIILLSLTQQIFSQDYSIPFRLTKSNNLSIQAILNKTDTVNLMFHTAANSVMLTEETTKKVASLKFERTDSIKSWGGGGNTSRYSKSNSLQIGELKWDSVPIWEDKYSGPETDGKFGIDLFRNKVIEIDFDKSVIVLHTDLPRKTKKYEKLKLIFRNDNMFLEATCKIGDSSYKNQFLIHSGYAGSVLLDDKFVNDHKLSEKLKIIDIKELKDSFGNVLKTKKAILPTFTIGSKKLSDVPVGFFEGAIGRQKMSIMGGDVLKRFNIIIDAQREYVYIRANSLTKTKYTGA